MGGLAYIERVRLLPSSFSATLVPEPDNRYLPHAIAVTVAGEKLGYVAPEVAREYWEAVQATIVVVRRAVEAWRITKPLESSCCWIVPGLSAPV